MPILLHLSAVILPIPWKREMGSCFKKSGPSMGVITFIPFGLLTSEATLAKNLL